MSITLHYRVMYTYNFSASHLKKEKNMLIIVIFQNVLVICLKQDA